jgi:hypothetical protein
LLQGCVICQVFILSGILSIILTSRMGNRAVERFQFVRLSFINSNIF